MAKFSKFKYNLLVAALVVTIIILIFLVYVLVTDYQNVTYINWLSLIANFFIALSIALTLRGAKEIV